MKELEDKYSIDQIAKMSENKLAQIWAKIDTAELEEIADQNYFDYDFYNAKYEIDCSGITNYCKQSVAQYLAYKGWLKPGWLEPYCPFYLDKTELYEKVIKLKNKPINYVSITTGYDYRIGMDGIGVDDEGVKLGKEFIKRADICYLTSPGRKINKVYFDNPKNKKELEIISKKIELKNIGIILRVRNILEAFDHVSDMVEMNYCACFSL